MTEIPIPSEVSELAASVQRGEYVVCTDIRQWLAAQFADRELVHMVATAIEGDGSGCEHADDLSCSTCTARTAVEAVNRALLDGLEQSGGLP